ncbi:MAG: gamma carbonic anhydrase family protein [Candidatus Aenigmarchaeota archaeon]|nr:gamma carbonic anhydrase family protein [Candidatus Aenigmarchaeota archaeon]
MILSFRGKAPRIHETCFIADNATIAGDVDIGENSSVWFGAAIRGDLGPVRIGKGSSVQDNCVIHTDPGRPAFIGDGVSLGHGVVVHGATVKSDCIIGIGAVLLNGCEIGEGSIVAAGAVVKEGEKMPPASLVVGVPGKVVRQLTDDDVKKIKENAAEYVKLGAEYRKMIL